MRRRHADRTHLVESHADAALGQGPGGLAPREPAADHRGCYDATSSGSVVSVSMTWCPHFRHLRVVSPVVFDLISSIPTNPQLGQGTITGLFAPAKTPGVVINRLNQGVVRVLQTPEVKDKVLATGVDVTASSPAQLMTAVKSEMMRLGKVIKDNDIRDE